MIQNWENKFLKGERKEHTEFKKDLDSEIIKKVDKGLT
jgi:hypothetical protein